MAYSRHQGLLFPRTRDTNLAAVPTDLENAVQAWTREPKGVPLTCGPAPPYHGPQHNL